MLKPIFRWAKRTERQLLVWWIRFAHRNQDSQWLPFVLFILLFLDGFAMVIPSTLCMIAAVTISPRRWFTFAVVFASAATLNNVVTYFVGRILPAEQILSIIQWAQVEVFWMKSQHVLNQYGAFATFFSAIIGLPVQMVTMLIGIADSQLALAGAEFSTKFWQAILFAAAGHGLKAIVFAYITKVGWIRLERRFVKKHGDAIIC